MKRYLCILLLATACQTPEQRAQRQAELAKMDTETCISYGLKPGSEAFGNCRLQLDLARKQPYNHPYYPRFHSSFHYGHFH